MQPKTADVVVIGAGVMGCAVARQLARRKIGTVVLERSVPGAEASSAAAGILGAQAESDGPGPFCDLLVRSRSLYPALVKELEDETGLSTGFQQNGIVLVAVGEAEEKHLEERKHWQDKLGLRTELTDRGRLAELEPALSPQITGGLYLPDDGQIEPPLLAKALSRSAQNAGAKFVQTTVRQIVHDEKAVRGVETDNGLIETRQVVLAAGAWSCQVRGAALASDAIRPARGQVVAIDTEPGELRRVIIRHGKGYLVPRRHGRVLAGSTLEYVGFHKAVTAGGVRGILEMAIELSPGLAAAPIGTTWSNFRPATADHLPILGEGPVRGIFFASGHYRNGILLTPVTAEVIAAAVAGEKPPIDLSPFTPGRFQGRPV